MRQTQPYRVRFRSQVDVHATDARDAVIRACRITQRGIEDVASVDQLIPNPPYTEFPVGEEEWGGPFTQKEIDNARS